MADIPVVGEIQQRKEIINLPFGTADGIAHALEAGAKGAITKTVDLKVLLAAIRAVAAGERYCASTCSRCNAERHFDDFFIV